MPAPSLAEQEIHCSFCTKPKAEVDKLIAGPGVYICNQCVDLCNAILGEQRKPPADPGEREVPEIPWPDTMTDEQILDHLPRVAAVSARVDADLQTWVERLRDRGVTWARIGTALGMARQSAWERFSTDK